MRWVEITMTTIMPQKNKEFDEEVFLEKCVESFSEIRKKYQLDEETLKAAKSNPILEKMAEIVIDGCTVQGILKFAKGMTEWNYRKLGGDLPWRILGSIWYRPPFIDPTEEMVKTVSENYEGTCRALRRKIDELEHLAKIIVNLDEWLRQKEQLVSAGDVKAMFFLGKIYEDEEFGVQNQEKANAYYQLAKDTWKERYSKRYEEWLNKAVQVSGLELIGRMGRSYIDGNFVQAGKKDHNKKLKKEYKWLTTAIDAGDGWAAFTMGNIYYYGYGRCKQKKKAAYNNYILAAHAEESIYALELRDYQLKNGSIFREIIKELSEM